MKICHGNNSIVYINITQTMNGIDPITVQGTKVATFAKTIVEAQTLDEIKLICAKR